MMRRRLGVGANEMNNENSVVDGCAEDAAGREARTGGGTSAAQMQMRAQAMRLHCSTQLQPNGSGQRMEWKSNRIESKGLARSKASQPRTSMPRR